MASNVLGRFLILVSVLTVACGGPQQEPAGEAEQVAGLPSAPHPIVLVAIDGIRTDYLGAYGGAAGVATPNLDALAGESVVFEWTFAQAPSFTASLAAILSGLYPTTNGLLEHGERLQDAAVTLAEAMAGAGVTTAAFVEGAPGGDDYGLGQGFDSYELGPQPGIRALEWLGQLSGKSCLVLIAGWSVGDLAEIGVEQDPPEGFVERLNDLLVERSEGQRALLGADDLEFARTVYAAKIRALDQRVGELMAELRRLGLDSRATLALVGTNGAALQEHDDLWGDSVYTTVTRVPMLLRLPGGSSATTIGKYVELIDLAPTLLELSGIEVPSGVQGASLIPMIEGGGTPPYIAFGESPAAVGQRFAALGGYRLVLGAADAPAEIYHLLDDPLELADTAVTEGDRVTVLERHLEAWAKMVAATSLDPDRRSGETLDDDTLDQLRSLGYVQ